MSRLSNLSTFRTFRFNILTAGTPEQLSPKIRAATIAFVDGGAAADTITDSGNGFLIQGFEADMIITVAGSTSNDGSYTITSVVAGTITLVAGDALTTEGAAATVTITTAGIDVPEGVAVVVKANRSNTGYIQVADSSAKADTSNTPNGAFELGPNSSTSIQVNNTSSIWVDSTVSGDDVEVILEVTRA